MVDSSDEDQGAAAPRLNDEPAWHEERFVFDAKLPLGMDIRCAGTPTTASTHIFALVLRGFDPATGRGCGVVRGSTAPACGCAQL